jgi:hypothetical protein
MTDANEQGWKRAGPAVAFHKRLLEQAGGAHA